MPPSAIATSASLSLLITCSGVCLFLAILPPFYGPILALYLDQFLGAGQFEREQIFSLTENPPIYEHDTMIVPHEKKKLILEEFGLLNFTRETLYPSLDKVADRITQHNL